MAKHSKVKEDNSNVKKSSKKDKRKKKHIGLIILLVIIILLGVFTAFIYVKAKELYKYTGDWKSAVLAVFLGHDATTRDNLDKLQVLIMGESTGMSDTIIVASYDPKTRRSSFVIYSQGYIYGR